MQGNRLVRLSVPTLQRIGGRWIGPGGGASCATTGGAATHSPPSRRRPLRRLASLAGGRAPHPPAAAGVRAAPTRLPRLPRPPALPIPARRCASQGRGGRKKADENAPLLNEHLIAELFNRTRRNGGAATADTYEVRLIVDRGRTADGEDAAGAEDAAGTEDAAGADGAVDGAVEPASRVTTVARAISLAHDLGLDLMEVTLRADPPVVKAVDFDRWRYAQKRRERKAAVAKKRGGGGAVSDRPLKEFKFRAGIADHDLERKVANMAGYLERGHAVRVTLTARRWMLVADEGAIVTTLDRVKELLGDRAVEARGMKANDRKSYGSLLLHPNKSSKA